MEKEIKLITIKNNSGLKLTLSNLGAAIFRVEYDDECLTRNVASLKDFAKKICYYGKTIGRTSNRIKGDKITIEGEGYLLSVNENGNVLHGGLDGLSNQIFDYEICEDAKGIKVVFSYCSKHLESGYPGELLVKVIYYLNRNENIFRIDYLANSDRTTLCSLTNHSYFTLGSSHIEELSLKMDSDYYLDVDKDLIAVGKKEVDDFFNFKKEKHLPKKGGIDYFFYLDKKEIVLSNDKYKLTINSDFEGCQIYTSNGVYPDPLYPECENTLDSVAIEPSDNHLDLHFLKRGDTYTRYIIYNIERLK